VVAGNLSRAMAEQTQTIMHPERAFGNGNVVVLLLTPDGNAIILNSIAANGRKWECFRY